MNKSNTDKLNVLQKQDTAEVEITLQEIARSERGKIGVEELNAQQEDFILEARERYFEEKENDRK